MKGSKRISFDFSADAAARLERMKGLGREGTYAGVVREALRMYEWALEEIGKGGKIGVVKEGGVIEVLVLR